MQKRLYILIALFVFLLAGYGIVLAAPPIVNITSPSAGSTVYGTVNVTASASDDGSVNKVEFRVDGVLVVTDTIAPYSFNWNTAGYSNGSHTLSTTAYDNENNTANDSITVTKGSGSSSGLTYGLVGWWKLNSDPQDFSGNNNFGTIPNGGSYVAGKVGTGAISLDGIDDHVTIPDDDSLDVSTFSAGGWIYVDSYGANWTPIMTKEDENGLNRNFGMYLNPGSGLVHYSFMGSCSSWNSFDAYGDTVALDTWTHVFMTFDGSAFKMYKNGNLLSTSNTSASPCLSSTAVRLGEPSGQPSSYSAFNGQMDDMRLYNRALTASEVNQLYVYAETGSSDTTDPAVSVPVVTPVSSNQVSGTVIVSATASDNVGVTSVQFFVDGVSIGSDSSSPYSASWDTTTVSDSYHSVTARALDAAGNSANSASRNVQVINQGGSAGSPVGTGSADLEGWAWSDNFHWISFNSTDSGAGGSVPYRVTVDLATGNMSGMAWSDHLGWISFNSGDTIAKCSSLGSNVPNVNLTTGAVTGFAYAMSYGSSLDGCIKLSGTNHASPDAAGTGGVTLNTSTGKFIGFAWGGDVSTKSGPGWIQFNAKGAADNACSSGCAESALTDVHCPSCAGAGTGILTTTCSADPTVLYSPTGSSVTYEGTADGGTGPYLFDWGDGSGYVADTTYERTLYGSDGGFVVQSKDSQASPYSGSASCPAVQVLGDPLTSYFYIGKTVATAVSTNYTVRQGGPMAALWSVRLTDDYACEASISSDEAIPTNWTDAFNTDDLNSADNGDGTKSWSGNTGTSMNATGVTPGIYNFLISCTNLTDRHDYNVTVKVNQASVIDI